MVDGYLNLGGKQLPFKRTLGAMKRFDLKFKGDITVLEMGTRGHEMRTEHIIAMMFLFIEAGYKAEGKECDITEEWIEDNVTMTDLNDITSILSGSVEQPAEDEAEPKKKYKGGE